MAAKKGQSASSHARNFKRADSGNTCGSFFTNSGFSVVHGEFRFQRGTAVDAELLVQLQNPAVPQAVLDGEVDLAAARIFFQDVLLKNLYVRHRSRKLESVRFIHAVN